MKDFSSLKKNVTKMHVLTTYQGSKSQTEPKFWFLIEMIVFRFCLNVSTYGSNNGLEVEDRDIICAKWY